VPGSRAPSLEEMFWKATSGAELEVAGASVDGKPGPEGEEKTA